MPYMDTQIIPRRIAAKKNREMSIENTVVINGVSYGFQRIHIFDNAMSVIVPDNFSEMNPEAAKRKYPSEYRPQLIMTNDQGSVNFAFNLLNYPLTKGQIEEKLAEWKTGIKRVNPSYVFLTERIERLNDTRIGYFDFKSYAIDGDMYNLMFITSINDKLLLGIFNCPFVQYKDWKRLVVQIILSIEKIPVEENAPNSGEGGL